MVGEEVEDQVGGVDVLRHMTEHWKVDAAPWPGMAAASHCVQLDTGGTAAAAICDALHFGTDRLARRFGPTDRG
jgi:hypothetical protein